MEKFFEKVKTRFPPEPSGYMHIGHLKAILISFKKSQINNGNFNLRIDDTNPSRCKTKYFKSIVKDLKYLKIYKNIKKITFTSDYFEDLYVIAKKFIKNGYAYVEKEGLKIISRERNLREFNLMKKGFYKKNVTLRSNINILSKNFNIKGNVMYRIKKRNHYITNRKWNIFPTYDFSHCICDCIEKITHSYCSSEFINNNFIYKWYIKKLLLIKKSINVIPKQIEFSKLEINKVILGKRKIKEIIKKNNIKKWNNKRLFTIGGLIKRGFNHEILKSFFKNISLKKKNNKIDFSLIRKLAIKNFNKCKFKIFIFLKPPYKIISTTGFGELLIEKKFSDLKIIKLRFSSFIKKIKNNLYKFKRKTYKKKITNWLFLNKKILIKLIIIKTINSRKSRNRVCFIYLDKTEYKNIKIEEIFMLESLGYFKKVKEKKICEVILFKNSRL